MALKTLKKKVKKAVKDVEKTVTKKPKAAVKAVEVEAPKKKKVKAPVAFELTGKQEAYCMKCKSRVRVKNPMNTPTSNGRRALTGTCKICGTKVFKFLGAVAA